MHCIRCAICWRYVWGLNGRNKLAVLHTPQHTLVEQTVAFLWNLHTMYWSVSVLFLFVQSALREGLKKLFHTHSVSSSTEIFSKRRKIYSLWRKTRVKWSSETWVLILRSLPFACGFQWISLHGGFTVQHEWFSTLAPFFLSLYHSLVVFNESHQHWHLTVCL